MNYRKSTRRELAAVITQIAKTSQARGDSERHLAEAVYIHMNSEPADGPIDVVLPFRSFDAGSNGICSYECL